VRSGRELIVNEKKIYYMYRENLRNGEEVGSSFAAYYEGEPLVDIWGGYADVGLGRPWTKDTLSIIFSATKGVTALLAALFVDRYGKLQYDLPDRCFRSVGYRVGGGTAKHSLILRVIYFKKDTK
jgi:hypothetical protein